MEEERRQVVTSVEFWGESSSPATNARRCNIVFNALNDGNLLIRCIIVFNALVNGTLLIRFNIVFNASIDGNLPICFVVVQSFFVI